MIARGQSYAIPVTEANQVGDARRRAVALATGAGLDEDVCSNLAIVTTELAGNLVKHGRGGELVLRVVSEGRGAVVEVLALDKGPGMENLAACMRDGFSTAGTQGTGLGAVKRLARLFDAYSRPGLGTAILAHVGAAEAAAPESALLIGAVCLPMPGEEACGDAWGVIVEPARAFVMVADGLGHGPLAAVASRAAVDTAVAGKPSPPGEALASVHAAIRGTRGAAVSCAEIDFVRRQVTFAGVGNVAGAVVSAGDTRQMVSHNGTLGHDARKIQEFVYPLPATGRVLLHSDGLATQWRPDAYPGLLARHPALLAGILYRDFTRGRDDVTVVVVRERAFAEERA